MYCTAITVLNEGNLGSDVTSEMLLPHMDKSEIELRSILTDAIYDQYQVLDDLPTISTELDGTDIVIEWGKIDTALGYYLDLSTNEEFSTFVSGYNKKDIGDVLTYTISSLMAGYYYARISYYNSYADQSGYSNKTFTKIPLSQPVITAATNVTNHSFDLNWGVVAGATGYAIEISENDFATIISAYNLKMLGEVQTYSFDGFNADTTYNARITAYNSILESVVSEVIDVTTMVDVASILTVTDIVTSGFSFTTENLRGITYTLGSVDFETIYFDAIVVESSPVEVDLRSLHILMDTTLNLKLSTDDGNGVGRESPIVTIEVIFGNTGTATGTGKPAYDYTIIPAYTVKTPKTLINSASSGVGLLVYKKDFIQLQLAESNLTLSYAVHSLNNKTQGNGFVTAVGWDTGRQEMLRRNDIQNLSNHYRMVSERFYNKYIPISTDTSLGSNFKLFAI